MIFGGQNWVYQHLASQDQECEEKPESRKAAIPLRLYILRATLLIVTALTLWQLLLPTATPICSTPVHRQEWRELNITEQRDYISAVLCLMDKESLFEPGSSRYDDFSYAHVAEGTVTHYAAAFLPWHRYFTHVYERTLVELCEYRGALPYWDWTLDASELTNSPIFDPVSGFGGSGSETSDDPGLFDGHCVMNGPFANTTRHWQSKSNGHGFDILRNPHCLSRGFRSGQEKLKLQSRISSTAVESVLSILTYDDFVDALEVKAHNSIPQFVKGDFYGLTAPNDPIFYLHHVQVDRLWWLWQQRDPQHRKSTYEGPRENIRVYHNSSHPESNLEDVISLGILSEPLPVRALMRTQSELLCYRY